jgi:hypothetical protein
MLEFQGVPGYNSDNNYWNTVYIITSKVLTSPTRWADSMMVYSLSGQAMKLIFETLHSSVYLTICIGKNLW